MDDASDLLAARRRKLEALRERGGPLFPNDFRPSVTTADVAKRFGSLDAETIEKSGESLALAGRMVGLRDFGRAGFLHLQDRAGRIQVYVKRDVIGDDGFETYRLADLGDVVAVEGTPFRTKTGELTIAAKSFRVLTKALRPLPEKWHGLADVETRFRQRYLDLIVNPDVADVFRKRSAILDYVRSFFRNRGFLEVETPMMQAIHGGAAARPFLTHHNALDIDLYMRVAPELYLKRLIAGGIERVFELGRVFRNEGVSTRHNPEFTILEFYMAYADYRDLMTLTEELFVGLAESLHGARKLVWGEHEIDLELPWERLPLREAVKRHAGAAESDLATAESIRAFATRAGLRLEKDWGHGKILLELFERFAEDELVQPTFVVGYPVEVSPLARRSDTEADSTDRFELYVGGREIANAFSELNDPDDQRSRFEAQVRAAAGGDAEAQPMDEDYLTALEHGMPPTAGEGIGIDRLVMMMTNQTSIRDVILFPLLRPQAGR